jgi:LPS sulfotransferase NodH
MLDGIETGYEDTFDFPERPDPPRLLYMLASVPRTGSTFVSHLLWRSGCLGAPLEYLNFLATGPYHLAYGAPDRQVALWRSALHRRTSPNGVFGIKCFSAQLRELQQANPALLLEVMAALLPSGRPAHVVRLKRRDQVAHAISYARAALSGVWHRKQEARGGAEVAFSARAVDHARRLLDQQEADWDLLFGEIAVEPLTLWYEDVIARPDEAVRAVADFLGVALDPAATVVVPQVERQATDDSHRWAELYAAAGGDNQR